MSALLPTHLPCFPYMANLSIYLQTYKAPAFIITFYFIYNYDHYFSDRGRRMSFQLNNFTFARFSSLLLVARDTEKKHTHTLSPKKKEKRTRLCTSMVVRVVYCCVCVYLINQNKKVGATYILCIHKISKNSVAKTEEAIFQ